jgi:hypothetical protein
MERRPCALWFFAHPPPCLTYRFLDLRLKPEDVEPPEEAEQEDREAAGPEQDHTRSNQVPT